MWIHRGANLPYNPNLAPCDFFLFKNLEQFLRGRMRLSDNKLKITLDDHFEKLPK
ncbi:hypothetical protein WH47_05343 [Habropoda laboriosa]|uniref:Histone-lysine N-methyltransferase SETMAR n=1 Tax=Habropoda laboriosa TaxID=597456 RepID=A0A0L7QTD9_9HYME|nr:hypothetical protein WH47_05343 [Habropoda laboriosa]